MDASAATEIAVGVWLGGCPKRACGEGGLCVSDLGNARAAFTCNCYPGFFKDEDDGGKCKEDKSVCDPNPCHPKADCALDGRGGFACLCQKGLVGDGMIGKLRYTGCKPAKVAKRIAAAKKKAAEDRKWEETPEALRKDDDDE